MPYRRLPCIDVLVVGLTAPHVGGAVDEPGQVQSEAVPEHNAHKKGVPQTLRPEKVGNGCRNCAPNQQKQRNVVFPLKPDHRVGHQVAQVYVLSLFLDSRVLFDQEPTNMREEETSPGVVGVGICLSVLVMYPMVATPLVDVVLEGHDVEEGKDYTQLYLGFICPVRPKPVCS